MFLHNHQLALFNATSSVAEARRVWTTTDPNQQQNRTETQALPDYHVIETKDEFLRRLEEALDQHRVNEADYNRLKTEGKAYYQQREQEHQRRQQNNNNGENQTPATELSVDDRIRAFESEHKEPDAQKAIVEIKTDRITSLKELREWTRQQLEDRDIKFESGSDQDKKKVRKLQHGFMSRIKDLLTVNPLDRNHRKIIAEFEREDGQARRCYERIRAWATDGPRQEFLKFLAQKKFPGGGNDTGDNGLHHSAQKILFLSKKIQSGPAVSDGYLELLNHAEAYDLHLLDDSFTAIEQFYDNWKNATETDENVLRRRLTEYDRKLDKVSGEIVGDKNVLDAIAKTEKREWSEIVTSRKNDIKTLNGFLYDESGKKSKNPGKSELKLVGASLTTYEAELQQYENNLFQYKKAERETKDALAAQAKAAKEHAAHGGHGDEHGGDHGKHGAHGAEHEHDAHEHGGGHGHGDHGHAHHGESEAMKAVWKKSANFFTAGGRITWYSFYDIGLAWHLVTDAFKKHAESVGEDKAGGLAKGLTHWRPVVEKRVLMLDLANEKKRANEMKEGLKHNDFDKLVAELAEPPPKDKQRAILEILADRGVLRMSDKRVIKALGINVTAEEWANCDNTNDYTIIRERFKQDLADHFHEPNYPQELLEKNNSGIQSGIEMGKKLNSKTDGTSPTAEFSIFLQQLGRAKREGEGKVAGAIWSMMNRANLFSNNGNKIKLNLRVDGHDEPRDYNCNMGTVGLTLIDAWLKGTISRELLGAEISKGNESLFNPLACIQDNVTARGTEVEMANGQKIKVSNFEKWGWIKEVSGEKTITALGATEIPKYFNTRAALAKDIATGEEKYVHISVDGGTYIRHSRRHTSIRDATNSDQVGDKLVNYLVKASSIELFDQATRRQLGTGSFVGETDQIAGLIKAGMEQLLDGKRMRDSGDRYYDRLTGGEIKHEDAMKMLNDPTKSDNVGRYGAEQMQLGHDILVRIMDNIVEYTESRSILNKNNQYRVGDPAKKGQVDENGDTLTAPDQYALGEYLKRQLANGGFTPETQEYRDIMAAFTRLNDPTQVKRRTRKDQEEQLTRAA